MVNTTTPEVCDVIVIGAGIGGLTAAGLLAKAGVHVCVVEMDNRPGGYLAGFRRGKFTFDTAIHWLNECGPGGIVRTLFDFIGPDAPETPALKKIRRYKGDSFDYLLTNNPDELRDQWIEEFPEDEKGIRRFFEDGKELGIALENLGPLMRCDDTMNFWEWSKMGYRRMFASLPFLKHLGKRTDKTIKKYFSNERLRSVYCSEEKIMSCLVPIGWAYRHDYQVPPDGGSQAFPQWLAKEITHWGSTVAYKSRVSEILIEDKKAVGVRIVQGRTRQKEIEIRAQHVISAGDLETLYCKMLPRELISESFLKRFNKAELYDSSVSINLALDIDPRNIGFGEELVFLTRDGLTREDHNLGDPEKTHINVLAPSIRDPSLAPEGKGTVTFSCAATIEFGDNWKLGPNNERGAEYKAFKQAYADIIIRRVEEAMAPGLSEHIEICDVATPVTHERYTGNKGGSIMGAKPTKQNIKARLAHYKTPVKNLIVCGHWAEYGGGVPIAVRSGSNAALMVLQKIRPEAYEIVKALVDQRPYSDEEFQRLFHTTTANSQST
jgi:phytoene dehydrogenase-like protein